MLKRLLIVGAVVALTISATVSPALAKKGGTDRPFKANLAGEVTFEYGEEGAEPCGSYQPGWGMSVITHTEATGNATHMGKVNASFLHCPTDIGHDNGHLTLTAANGDEVFVEYVDDGTTGDSFPIAVVGGTGRFTEATGSMTLYYWLDPAIGPDGEPDFFAPWGWSATIRGEITY